MLLYVSLLGLFISIILIYNNAKYYPSSIYLGIYIFLVSLYGVNQYVILWSESICWISIFHTNFTCLYYLVGPMSYLYIRSVLTDDIRLRKTDLLHLLPALVYFIAALPHLFSSYAYKLEVAHRTITEPGFTGTYHFTILTDWFTSAGVYISRPALVFIYALVCGILIFRYFSSKDNPKPLTDQGFMKRWLLIFLLFQLLLIVSHLFYLINSFSVLGQFSASHNHLANIISSVTLIGFIVSPILFPQVLYGLPNLSRSSFDPEKDKSTDSSKQKSKSKEKTYDQEYLLFMQEKVENAMTKNKVYLQKEFNLPQLSVLIQIPIHHLAYFFTNFKRQSFNDYRNVFRIRHAKQLILQSQSEIITLEAIGLLSGFSNRNTFSKAFKKMKVPPLVFSQHNLKNNQHSFSSLQRFSEIVANLCTIFLLLPHFS